MPSFEFIVPIGQSSEQIADSFQRFADGLPIDEPERRKLLNSFKEDALPSVERTLALLAGGSNAKYSKTLLSDSGEVQVTFDSTKRGLLGKLKAALGG
ncbi:hypothetical protein [Ruegeria arenilitoris]|uniref:hypothetical protein n=1 Tax=Ruegeria arenilitoris TaxID=1173585 RepID=UPI00147A0E21|nr:hypothetical protein [Ruegeria arenilitoris]